MNEKSSAKQGVTSVEILITSVTLSERNCRCKSPTVQFLSLLPYCISTVEKINSMQMSSCA